MLTLDELRFINNKPGTTPIPNESYCRDVINNLEIALKIYDERFAGKLYRIFFSNNQNVKLRITKGSLSHVLGVFTCKEQCEEFTEMFYGDDEEHTKYKALIDIINNKEEFLYLNNLTNGTLFNFYRIKSRLEAFIKMAKFEKYEFYGMFIDEEVTKQNNFILEMQSRIFFIMESGEPLYPYYALGLNKKEEQVGSNGHYVETLFPNLYNDFFINQEIAIPLAMKVELEEKEFVSTISTAEKLKSINSILKLRQMYGAKIDHDKYLELLQPKRELVR